MERGNRKAPWTILMFIHEDGTLAHGRKMRQSRAVGNRQLVVPLAGVVSIPLGKPAAADRSTSILWLVSLRVY